jgi:hypothetical protein
MKQAKEDVSLAFINHGVSKIFPKTSGLLVSGRKKAVGGLQSIYGNRWNR